MGEGRGWRGKEVEEEALAKGEVVEANVEVEEEEYDEARNSWEGEVEEECEGNP